MKDFFILGIVYIRFNIVERLSKNPYALVPFSGLSKGYWPKIEKCARDLGIGFENDGRLIGAIEHVLYRRLKHGHTATSLAQIYQDAIKITKSNRRVLKGIALALKRRRICVYRRKGDPAQISPVGFGLVWHQMVKSKIFPKIHLSIDHRQGSELNSLSMKIRSNQKDKVISLPVWKGQKRGVFLIPANKKDVRDKFVELKRFEKEKQMPLLQILTPHMSDRYPDSGNKINRYIQKNLNGHAEGFRIGQGWLRIGDPVIVTKNSYGLGLFNGMAGVITEIQRNEGQIVGVFKFEGKKNTKRLSIMEMYSVRIRLAYAISFHKSQGSEYEATAVSCVIDSDMVERSLLYTAVSRAKKLCIIVGSEKTFILAANKPPRAETLDVGFMSNLPLDKSKIFTEIGDITRVA